MRLKSLEIKGFKSFANETVINFNEDVIGIVGPNGSGKSNIVDAIRWVLGEQKSKELRLDQMSSVIFNGTRKRKAGGMAQVSLTFENTKNLLPTDYHTVTITRMIYRTGETEYRLNGVACRLKDITSLFLDTGIGSNSYAIIALGMVDDILSDKDNSRRRMFEQAAGVSKYKMRKRETLAKLKSTSDDLDRIEDLLYEISNSMSTLEKQAKRAKKYFELKAEYKVLSVELSKLKIASLKVKQQALTQQLTTETDRHRQLEVDIAQMEAGLEAERKNNLDKEKALSERQRELNQLMGQVRGQENEKRMLEQKQQFVIQNKSKLGSDIQQAQARVRQLEEDIAHFGSELSAEKRVEARLELELEAAEAKLAGIRSQHGAIKTELDEVVKHQQAAERALFELEKQKAVNSNEIDNNRQQALRNRLDIEMRVQEVAGLRDKTAAIQAEEKAKADKLEQLEKAEELRLGQIQTAETALDELQKKLNKVNREMDAKRNEYKLTQSMIESLEGFPESIRFLSQHKDWKKGASLLSDVIYVQESYRIAIENYLEPYLNYYVVDTLEEAYQAIQLLSRSQKGKANFFVLDAFRDYQPPMIMLPGTLQATELVETDPAYRNLCAYLLEQVLITESEDIKRQFSDDNSLIFLSRDGSYIRRRYSISGGSIGLFEGKKIGRKKNLELLESALKTLEREDNRLATGVFELKNKITDLKAQKNNNEIQQERHALGRLAQERVSLTTRLENFETFIREADAQFSRFEETVAQLTAANVAIDARLEEEVAKVAAIKSDISNADVSYRQIAEELSQASTGFNERNIAFIRQQNKVTALQRELAFREKQLEETRSTLAANEQLLAQSDGELFGTQNSIDQLQEVLLKLYEQRKALESSLTEAEQAYFSARGGINEQEDKLRRTIRAQQEAQILVNQLKEKTSDVKFEISSVAQRIRIEFELDINAFINEAPEDPNRDPDELQLKVERVKGRIDGYGDINPMAVEAYDEMKERHETITTQRDDIVAAKSSLLQTIKEIEETATAQFLEAFSQARLHFIEVFRSLFTEDDNCDLILLEPDNPLESRIEIVAKPKGKRPQTISQLSGGEKTLTATALLFALYLLKPAPFCIFDEVDAPLDDANISKFNNIIKKFSKDSQFIIVTHNKLTMAAVDTIYGVYMAEQGISGVSPVDFRDFEHTATFETRQN